MTIQKQSVIHAAATVLALLFGGLCNVVKAQPLAPSSGQMTRHQTLIVAYGDSMSIFARTLQRQARGLKFADVGVARSTVGDMRRSFDQMQEHHQARVALMGEDLKSMLGDDMTQPKSAAVKPMKPMVTMMQQLETQLTALKDHLGELEAAVGATVPSTAKVSTHTAHILEHCAVVSRFAKPVTANPTK